MRGGEALMIKEIARMVRDALADWPRTFRLGFLLALVAAIASWILMLSQVMSVIP
jgi:hypothetical protein